MEHNCKGLEAQVNDGDKENSLDLLKGIQCWHSLAKEGRKELLPVLISEWQSVGSITAPSHNLPTLERSVFQRIQEMELLVPYDCVKIAPWIAPSQWACRMQPGVTFGHTWRHSEVLGGPPPLHRLPQLFRMPPRMQLEATSGSHMGFLLALF